MLHYETVLPDTLEILKRIQSLAIFKESRLVGGTSLALQLGHRKSVDLEIYGKVEGSIEEITAEISAFASVSPLSSTKMMKFLIVNGVKVDIVNYPYSWIDEPIAENGIVLAGINDVAALKLAAVAKSGTKKDFVDFFALLKSFTVDEMVAFYIQKYNTTQLFDAIKSLTYFEDAEKEPMPVMIESVNWSEIKSAIIREVDTYLKKQVDEYSRASLFETGRHQSS